MKDFSSVDLREGSDNEILNYLKDSFQKLEENKISFYIEEISCKLDTLLKWHLGTKDKPDFIYE